MNAWVMLLRGINVGGHNKLPMAGLRNLLECLGARNVASHLQSGNVVFTGIIDARSFGEIIESEIHAQYDIRPRVFLYSRESFNEIAQAYPWPEVWRDPTAGHIWFLDAPPTAEAPELLTGRAAPTERYTLTDRALYLNAPDGIGQSMLAASAERVLGVPATARNLNTVSRLQALLVTLPKE